MHETTPFADGCHGPTDRDASGRFTPGNRAAVGHRHPFARQAAALRRAFYEAITEEDLRALARQLITRAKAGDLAAAKLALLWLLGKPGEPVNPDGPLPIAVPAGPSTATAGKPHDPAAPAALSEALGQRQRLAVIALLREARQAVSTPGLDAP